MDNVSFVCVVSLAVVAGSSTGKGGGLDFAAVMADSSLGASGQFIPPSVGGALAGHFVSVETAAGLGSDMGGTVAGGAS